MVENFENPHEYGDVWRRFGVGIIALGMGLALIGLLSNDIVHETRNIVVCDSVSMRTYSDSCLDALMRQHPNMEGGEVVFWAEEFDTQANQLHCEEKPHIWLKDTWVDCDSLPPRKRQKYCGQ